MMASLWCRALLFSLLLAASSVHADMKLDCKPGMVSLVWTEGRSRVDTSKFRLGNCPPTATSAREATFTVELHDCNFMAMVTGSQLVYSNALTYLSDSKSHTFIQPVVCVFERPKEYHPILYDPIFASSGSSNLVFHMALIERISPVKTSAFLPSKPRDFSRQNLGISPVKTSGFLPSKPRDFSRQLVGIPPVNSSGFLPSRRRGLTAYRSQGEHSNHKATEQAVDYESRSSYSFSVEVLNPTVDPRFLRRGPFKDRASIRVAVLDADEPPRFSRARYHMDVSENCPPACTVGRVSAVDPDTGLTNNIRFSIDPQSDPEALFRITPDSGLITTAMELDREREHWHNITVIATQRDNPSQVSRVLVAIETLDLNDNAPELDRQYTTAMCDSSTIGQVVQVLRAIDRDEGGNDSSVFFSIPPESGTALNFSVRDSGGPTASLVLLSQLQPLSRSSASTLTLHVPLVLRDGTSGLTSTGTVTVSVCPCLRGGAKTGEKGKQAEGEWDWEREAVCLPQHSTLPSPGLSTAALLAILACVATLLAVSALSLSLRRQKRDSLSPLEDDDVRENIITYDDEGGGEADTAAFDIAALQSAPHSSRSRTYRTLDSRNVRYAQRGQDKGHMYSWTQNPGVDHNYSGPGGPLYGRLCYSSHTLPVLRRAPGGAFEPGLAELGYHFPGGQPDHSLVIQNQAAMVGPMDPGAVYVTPADLSAGSRTGSQAGSRDGTATQSGVSTSDEGTPQTGDSQEKRRGMRSSSNCTEDSSEDRVNHTQDLDWVQSETLPRENNLVLTRSGSTGAWMCDSATLPVAGRRASRAGVSTKGESDCGGGAGTASSDGQAGNGRGNYAAVLQGEAPGRGGLEMGSNFVVARPEREAGGMSLTGTPSVYPDSGLIGDWRDRVGLGGYVLARMDMTPQLLPFAGQPRGAYGGVVGFSPGWGPGMEASRGTPGSGGPSLALRVGEFLRLRLAQVTFDPSQPPYDSVQIYGLEGTGSRAGSLSSLESEGEKEADKEDWGAGLEEWGPQFQKLAQLFRDHEKEKETKEQVEDGAKEETDKRKD
ncbi:uncharacterized protein LOC133664306 [Entelurus aequoreus]|uniref:uncharacterized protein LOC133664306 n=1 Tax=Entelurus aequoreus TaxID=161455 RepID=UPI002B1CF59C|nr:uncharacterized protein LOC133664306 [Entelurus aequoreus]